MFVCGHYLFQEVNSFQRVKLEENCELRETDNVKKSSEHIFDPNRGYCPYYLSILFHNAHGFENWGIFSDIPSFRGIFSHVTCLDQLRTSKKI